MMNMSGTGGYILHAFKMYVFPSALALIYFRSDTSLAASMIPMHKQYSYTVKRSVRSRNPPKFKIRQSHLVRTS